jgi:hypothetical protein
VIPTFAPTNVDPAVTADITSPGRYAGGVLTISADEYGQLSHALEPVQEAFAKAATSLVTEQTMTTLASTLGVDGSLCETLPERFAERSFDLLRLDFILSHGHPVVLEANFGAAVGGSIDVEAHAAAADVANCEPNSARMRWAALQTRQLGHTELFLPHWPWSHIEGPDVYFASSRAVVESERVDLRIVSFAEFAQMQRDDPKPRVALRLFASLDAVRRGIDLNALGYGPGTEITWLQDETVAIPSNKSLMASAALQEPINDGAAVLPSSALALDNPVDGFICLPIESIRRNRLSSVLKPTADHGGTGVLVGPGSTDTEWQAGVDAAANTLTLVQAFFPTDEVEFVNRFAATEKIEAFTGPVSYGAYFVQGEMTGVLARVGNAQMRNSAVNGNTGAVLTALVPRGSR